MKKIILILIFTFASVFGQTDAQIKQAKTMIKSTGMSESQVKAAAKAKGYSDQQIDAAIQKEKNGKTNSPQSSSESNKDIGLPDLGTSNEVAQEKAILDKTETSLEKAISDKEELVSEEELTIIGDEELEIVDEQNLDFESEAQPGRSALRYFGYDIFKRDPAIFQATSVGAVDPDYLIGPGDEIIVMLWGETQFRQVLSVDREGFVFIPEVGQVFVNGLNLKLLESKLFRVLSQSYASLSPQGRKSTTFLDVSIGNLRPLRVQVLGEVAQPGAYTVSPSATLFSALYYFNGPTTLGSLRDIRLIRAGKEIASIDFYDYLLTGKKPNDHKLQLDDVIFIPKRLKTVTIEGEVNRPGIYEPKPNESLIDLMGMAGNLKITAYLDRAQIDRIVPFEDRAEVGMDRMFNDVNLENVMKDDSNFPLQDGDRIQVFSVLDLRLNVVDLRGAITRPGSYDLGESLTLSKLIEKADGLLGDAYLDRIDVTRIKPDFTEMLIKLDLNKVLAGDPENDIELQGLDRVRIYGMTEMVPWTYVSISGHVKQSGRYLLQENMTLYDLIFKAGGFVDEEYKKRAYLKRAELVRVSDDSITKEIIPFNLGLVLDKIGLANELLKANDAIQIYSISDVKGTTKYASISGYVKNPGQYELFEENMTAYDLLFKAGGFSDKEWKEKVHLDRADLLRLNNDQITRTISKFNLGQLLESPESNVNFLLEPGDIIKIYNKDVFISVKPLTINGSVKNPGKYELKNNMCLKDLILEAGGISENVYRYKVDIARIDPNNTEDDKYATILTMAMDEDLCIINENAIRKNQNVKTIESGNGMFFLQPYDIITVRPDPKFLMQKTVTVDGAVWYPGSYVIQFQHETITDIIERAGGIRPEAYPMGSSFTRGGVDIQLSYEKILKNPSSKSNFTVKAGDQITIREHPELVYIRGEVNSPGAYKYIDGKNLRYYILNSGNYTPDADKANVFIQFPDGTSKRHSKWSPFSPKIPDGSIITIATKKEEEPINKTELARDIAGIFADFAQVIAMVLIAGK
ncbi:MAG: SLBB domain-containing protein [Candidatus Marinimicrobia bacterium]|nr:SLBB domain-containing protein [Candidatus Neomarinimicrobiota bacterium]